MSDAENLPDLTGRVADLEELVNLLVTGIAVLVDQNIALISAVSHLRARLQRDAALDGAELADLAIAQMKQTSGSNEAREALLRSLLEGASLQLPEMPKLTVIRGGKDGLPPKEPT